MRTEFTGERVIPGEVDADLWNEHFARYAFAVRFAADKRVLDAGCGTGYGSAELARLARAVTGIDLASEAVEWAGERYAAANVTFSQASCIALPFAAGSFDLVVAFEVIEHLADWPRLLDEARRVLAPGGRLVVSTPNKSFYAETRRHSGPNPYHEHEFEYGEFRDALARVFPHVAMFVEDHVQGVAFHPVARDGAAAETRVEGDGSVPEESTFFIAVCSDEPVQAGGTFFFVPRTANLLREKLLHIERLESEIATKDGWIRQEQAAHQELLSRHKEVIAELEKSNQWAESLNETIAALRGSVSRLEEELTSRTHDLQHQTAELGRCVEALHQTEATLEERTRWALSLDEQRVQLEAALADVQASRWVRLGRAVGLGPELQNR